MEPTTLLSQPQAISHHISPLIENAAVLPTAQQDAQQDAHASKTQAALGTVCAMAHVHVPNIWHSYLQICLSNSPPCHAGTSTKRVPLTRRDRGGDPAGSSIKVHLARPDSPKVVTMTSNLHPSRHSSMPACTEVRQGKGRSSSGSCTAQQSRLFVFQCEHAVVGEPAASQAHWVWRLDSLIITW